MVEGIQVRSLEVQHGQVGQAAEGRGRLQLHTAGSGQGEPLQVGDTVRGGGVQDQGYVCRGEYTEIMLMVKQ